MKDLWAYITLGVILLLFVGMIMAQTRRRRTAQAEYAGMLDTLRTGMRVKTVGGVIGKIKEIREEAPGFKTVLLETGTDKNPSLVLYDFQAIYGIVDDEAIQAQKAAIQNHEDANKMVNAPQEISKPQETKPKSNSTNKTAK